MRLMKQVAAIAMALWSTSALAGSTYLNGVKIDGVTNQKFEKVDVRIDEQGNLFIDAPGYQVRQVEAAPAQGAAAPTLSKKYFLVTEQTVVGMTEYDIDLYVNSKLVRKLRSGDEQIVTEITRHLSPGKNTVLMVAKKTVGKARKSYAREHVYRVIIGEGSVTGEQVTIENPVIKFERSAADTQDVNQEFQLVTR